MCVACVWRVSCVCAGGSKSNRSRNKSAAFVLRSICFIFVLCFCSSSPPPARAKQPQAEPAVPGEMMDAVQGAGPEAGAGQQPGTGEARLEAPPR